MPPQPGPPLTAAAAVQRAGELARHPGPRRLLGLAGPPGAGKSTLAAQLAARLGRDAVIVPLDGYHLADAELVRLGRLGRKGAPDTFDVAGFLALLARIRRASPGETVYAPSFHRQLDEPIAGSIPVPAHTPLVIIEGNYLLLSEPPWTEVRGFLDEVWWVDLPSAERRRRLEARHIRWGKTPEAAHRFVARSDEANARAVAPGRAIADLIIAAG